MKKIKMKTLCFWGNYKNFYIDDIHSEPLIKIIPFTINRFVVKLYDFRSKQGLKILAIPFDYQYVTLGVFQYSHRQPIPNWKYTWADHSAFGEHSLRIIVPITTQWVIDNNNNPT